MPIHTRSNIRIRPNRRRGPQTDRVLHARIRTRAAVSKALRTGFLALVVLLAVGSAAWGVWAGGSALISKFFINNPEYAVEAVEVLSDGPLDRDKILAMAGLSVGQNIFLADLHGARRRIASLPQVEDARIVRHLPRSISIRIRVRKPVAWIAPAPGSPGDSLAREAFLVDARGFVFPDMDTEVSHLSLPFIYGCPELPVRPGQALTSRESLAAIEFLRLTADTPLGVRLQVQHIDLSRRYCMLVTDRRKSVYQFGIETEGLRSQLDQLAALLDAADAEGKRIQSANLMMRRNIPVVFAGTPPLAPSPQIVTTAPGAPGVSPPPRETVRPAQASVSQRERRPAAAVRRAESPAQRPVRAAAPAPAPAPQPARRPAPPPGRVAEGRLLRPFLAAP